MLCWLHKCLYTKGSFHTKTSLYFFFSAIFVNIPQRIRKNRWMWDKFLISQFLIATLWFKEKNEVFFIVFYSRILRQQLWGVMGKWFCRRNIFINYASSSKTSGVRKKQMCIFPFIQWLTHSLFFSLLISVNLFCGNARYVFTGVTKRKRERKQKVVNVEGNIVIDL